MKQHDKASWSMDDIPYGALRHDAVRDNEQLFYILASASFIEITSDLYTHNLVELFRDDAEIVRWLEQHWEQEEVQHGLSLKRYVQTAWPEFDWEAAYRSFFGEYQPLCALERLAPGLALEMVARCVVETGTASFYRTLSEVSPEPVLRQLAGEIANDEVRHYKYFYRFFLRYREREQTGRLSVLRTLWSRMGEIDTEDAFLAFKHVYLVRHPGAEFHSDDYRAFQAGFRRLAREHFPYDMATKMLLKPLDLSAPLGRVAVPTFAAATRLLMRR